MIFALAGNQNCGKTTLYNALTGAGRHTGNYPGITVDTELGAVKGKNGVYLWDMPGLYSLDTVSFEEDEAKNTLLSGAFDAIINVADGGNLERSLSLTLRLLELGKPMVLAVNMMDEVERSGGRIDVRMLSDWLGIPVVTVSGAKGINLDKLLSAASRAAAGRGTYPVCGKSDSERFDFISSLLGEAVFLPESPAARRTAALDKLLCGKRTGIPIFILFMALVFALTFFAVGGNSRTLLEKALEGGYIEGILTSFNAPPLVISLTRDGVIGGVGSVLGFLPVILTLFFCLAVMEDTGYMARAAFILDRPMRALGLSGRAVVPLLMGFGCTVPAVMATRTLMTKRERWKAVFLTPFISCPAKLPIYAAIGSVFFPKRQWVVMAALYALGLIMAAVSAGAMKLYDKDLPPFMLELPVYRLPTLKNVFRLLWQKAGDFIKRALTVILLASVAVWALESFGANLLPVSDPGQSLLATAGRALEPVFAPLGFDWRIISALVAGLTAKEAVLSTLDVLFAGDISALVNTLSRPDAVGLLVFTLLYCPCAAAAAAVKKELDSRLGAQLYMVTQLAIAYIAAYLARGVFTLFS